MVDSKGEIYAASGTTDAIVAFAPNSDGNPAPNRTIAGSKTRLDHPVGLALDARENLYVSSCGSICGGAGSSSIEVFPPQANGNIAPTRRIAGFKTRFTKLHQIMIGENGEIYAANARFGSLQPSLEVFSAGANGNHAPLRVIAGDRTDLSGGGIAVGKHGIYGDSYADPLIERFAPKAHGNVAPVAQIEGYRTRLNNELDGMWLGPNDTLYAADRNVVPQVVEFDGLASGDVPPLAVIAGSNTRLHTPLFVTVGRQP